MGYDNPKKKVSVRGLAGVSGGSLPAQIWREYMDLATRGRPNDPFPRPAKLGGVVLNPPLRPRRPPSPPPQPGPQNPPPTQPAPTQPGPSVPPPATLPGPG